MSNQMSRWNPATVAATREPLFRLFDTFFGNENQEDVAGRTWTPPVDIQETDNAYKLQVELPGMTKDDINISLENNVLRVSGERKFEKEVQKENYHRIERSYGSFARSFALPQQVETEGVEAKFENGVLSVTVPKAEKARPRKIEIA